MNRTYPFQPQYRSLYRAQNPHKPKTIFQNLNFNKFCSWCVCCLMFCNVIYHFWFVSSVTSWLARSFRFQFDGNFVEWKKKKETIWFERLNSLVGRRDAIDLLLEAWGKRQDYRKCWWRQSIYKLQFSFLLRWSVNSICVSLELLRTCRPNLSFLALIWCAN